MTNQLKKCSNCDGVIGRLEKSCRWQGYQVCRSCRERLEAMTSLPPTKSSDAPGESNGGAARVQESSRPKPVRPKGERTEAQVAAERIVWENTPSQVTNLKTFSIYALICLVLWIAAFFLAQWESRPGGLFIPFGLAIISLLFLAKIVWHWLVVRHTRYVVRTQRLRIVTGIFSQKTEEIELYRVKDTALLRPFFLRLFGLGHVVLLTSDRTAPSVIIQAIPGAAKVRETLRLHVEERRDKKRVREVDFE